MRASWLAATTSFDRWRRWQERRARVFREALQMISLNTRKIPFDKLKSSYALLILQATM